MEEDKEKIEIENWAYEESMKMYYEFSKQSKKKTIE